MSWITIAIIFLFIGEFLLFLMITSISTPNYGPYLKELEDRIEELENEIEDLKPEPSPHNDYI
jgi:hypothetical protein